MGGVRYNLGTGVRDERLHDTQEEGLAATGGLVGMILTRTRKRVGGWTCCLIPTTSRGNVLGYGE